VRILSRYLVSLPVLLLSWSAVAQQTSRTQTNPAVQKNTMMNVPVTATMKAAAQSAAAQGCDASLLKHVYHPTRLQMISPCIEVTGTVLDIKAEADGDDHIQFRVDPQFANLLDSYNQNEQNNTLVLEPICQGLVTQADAIKACRDFHSPVTVPAEGTKVRVLGRFVLDQEADHGWTEIHPVTRITPIQ
jgi:hypothetical protein